MHVISLRLVVLIVPYVGADNVLPSTSVTGQTYVVGNNVLPSNSGTGQTYVVANNDLPSTSDTAKPPDSPQPPCYYPQQSCNYDYSTSHKTGLSECRDPTYDICFIPRSNALQYTAYPLTISQGAYNTALFVSSVEITPMSRFWDGVCLTHIKLTRTLYVQIRTVTQTDGSYFFVTYLFADEVASPGSFVASRNSQYAKPRIEYSTITGNATISTYSFRGIYIIPTYGACYGVHFFPKYSDLTTTYPPLIPASVRSQTASQLLRNAPNKRLLAYENNAYCVTSLNGNQVLNPQTTYPATGVSLPQN